MRYFKYGNNARTMTRTGRPLLATGTRILPRALRGFGLSDPVLGARAGYHRVSGDARTMTRTGRPPMATGTNLITRSLHGFGQTDPVLDAAPDGFDKTLPTGEELIAAAAAADAEAAGAGDVIAPPVVTEPPVSVIQFYPDGTTIQRGVVGNTLASEWWDKLETALGTPSGEGRTADTLLQMADGLQSSKSMWKWATIIGVPVVGIAAFLGGRAMGRRGK